MTTAKTEPILSGAHLAPSCDRDVCDGYRSWDTPTGPAGRHCGCPKGRREAEEDYARRNKQPAPALPKDYLAEVAS